MPTNNKELSWERVEKYLAEKTAGGDLMSLVETEKIFKQIVENFDLPGEDFERKVQALSFVFSEYEDLKQARSAYQKAIEKANFSASNYEIKNDLAFYYQAIKDLVDFEKKKMSAMKKIKLYLSTFLPKPKVFIKKFVLIFLIFFLIIFLLDATSFGRMIVDLFVSLSHLIFSWVLFVILLIAGIAILAVGTIYYFQGRRK
ncbi:MAG: hypothetical protein PHN19_03375 [Patescibacteria group bacterium]|nr:hypothetical protein [Patescibacteria group bacterium]